MQLTFLDMFLLRIAIPLGLAAIGIVLYRHTRTIQRLAQTQKRHRQEYADTLRIQNEYIVAMTTNKNTVVRIGDVWKPRLSDSTWRVVGVTKERVTLSGPLPARSVQYVTMRDFLSKWDMVSRT